MKFFRKLSPLPICLVMVIPSLVIVLCISLCACGSAYRFHYYLHIWFVLWFKHSHGCKWAGTLKKWRLVVNHGNNLSWCVSCPYPSSQRVVYQYCHGDEWYKDVDQYNRHHQGQEQHWCILDTWNNESDITHDRLLQQITTDSAVFFWSYRNSNCFKVRQADTTGAWKE